ncbi:MULTISPECIES: glycosyltransferase [unclassified Amycolatopsis]|uniref:glycosyltransferase n=1 Tax=unclassified Amycolatopsis TaxID=2618356 RepID=UPI002874762F|nr:MULTISPECIES: glycosyltransferase [unclassified Amycolatopsis]MDS0139461.1 glycosyltransferase family 1 protein [Amycolatopsis sp. 505]MDS0147040.1 glycosyltransferase family 1 protein [Amycolatopsis sp. CM201R]
MSRLVVIVAPGSRGDVQPCVALGRGLAAHGDRVRVLAASAFRGLVESHGLGFAPLSADPAALLGSAVGQAWTGGRRFLSGLRAVLRPVLDTLLADVHAGAAGADLVLAPSLGFLGAHLGAHLGVPDVELHYQPSVPTRAFAHPLLPRATRLGPWARHLSFTAVDAVAWQVLRPEIDRWRAETLGLPRTGRRGPRRRSAVLCGFSDAVVPRPPDWPARVHLTGYWFLDTATPRPDPRLRDFLAAGPPPVYVGFGSMRPADAARTSDVVRAALRRARLRGVLSTGADADDVLVVGDVPHDWLFPRTAAVVHHGGAGTTAAGLRAGVPALVCPVFSDQPYWGDRVSKLSAGPKPVPLEELDVDTLTARLRELTGNPLFRRGAQYVGARLRAEDGVARACSLLRAG